MRRRLTLAVVGVAAATFGAVAIALTLGGEEAERPAGSPPPTNALPPATPTATSPRSTPAPAPTSTAPERPPAPSPPPSPPPIVGAPPPSAAPPVVRPTPFLVGVVEDTVKLSDRRLAAQRVRSLRASGFRALRMTTIWTPGSIRPVPTEVLVLTNAVRAARTSGMRVYLSIFNATIRNTPATAARRHEFAAFAAALARALPSVRDFIVGNEPNLNTFWMPQFDADGTSAAPRDYNALLATTYDALKAVSPQIRVHGGALGPRGGDDPSAPRHTHSPTAFLREWGRAYRASGRRVPVMDGLAYHPYLEYSRLPPEFEHPRTTTISLADYGKLVAALGDAFDGTAQLGSALPILYTEFGVQTRVPPQRRALYENHEASAASDAVDGTTQAAYYARAIKLAGCQPTVTGIFLFLAFDEPDVARWQSGVFYVDGAPKPSRAAVHEAAARARAGKLDCRD